ncbi:MAG: hypothetical protein IJC76_05415 [Lachnospiraceae bacterium]|nr:hypothetical protein [Lachnospiraceae bacterium]
MINNLDGANCQTLFPRSLSQREAAIEAVKKIGLPQIREVDMSVFDDMKNEAEMFQKGYEGFNNKSIFVVDKYS